MSAVSRSLLSRLAATALVAGLAACATPPEDPAARAAFDEANDPIEPTNRYIFDVNLALDDLVINPLSTMYREGVPDPFRDGIRNFLNNLEMPVTILNSALQGDWENTVDSSVSFFINTTVGLGGVFDIPGNFDHEPRREDFGQTLAVWGTGEGPYLQLPVIGPSNVRDTVGLAVDIATDPLTYVLAPIWSYLRSSSNGIQLRSDAGEQLDTLRRTSIDYYAAIRSLYRQSRDVAIANGGEGSPDSAFDDGYVLP